MAFEASMRPKNIMTMMGSSKANSVAATPRSVFARHLARDLTFLTMRRL